MRTLAIWLILAAALPAQIMMTGGHRKIFSGGGTTPISLDASCTGNPSTANPAPCSSAMTVTAGDDIIVKCSTNGTSFDPSNIVVSDPINGYYDIVQSNSQPAGSNDWVVYAIFQNSAGGSITPQCTSWEANGWVISAQAWSHARSTFALDSGSVNQFHLASSAATNPTSGQALASGTYTSGLTATGSGTCSLSVTNAAGSPALVSVTVTGGTVGSTLTIIKPGYGYTTAPTSATVQSFTSTTCSGTATISTSISSGTPTNNNEAIICELIRATAATTTAGTGFTPSGTLTATAQTIALYDQYQIQTSATAQNCPYTSASAKYTNGQIALLNASNPQGAKALGPGVYRPPAAVQTNGATVTAAILNSTSGSLSTLAPPGDTGASWWTMSGSGTFDTSVHPLGTLPLLVNGVYHVLGDAGTSVKIPSATTSSGPEWNQQGMLDNGTGAWYGQFVRIGTNEVSGQGCDTFNLDSTLVEGAMTMQINYNTGPGVGFVLEINAAATPSSSTLFPSTALNLGQDYYMIAHAAGVDDANDDVYIYGEAKIGRASCRERV